MQIPAMALVPTRPNGYGTCMDPREHTVRRRAADVRVKLTDRFIEGLPLPPAAPGGKGVKFYRDSQDIGFALRITETGSRKFLFETKYRGRIRRVLIGSFPATGTEPARRRARELRALADKGEDPAAASRPQAQWTFGQLFKAWRTGSLHDGAERNVPLERRKRSARDDEQRIRDYLEPWSKRFLDEITPEDVADLYANIASEHPVTANRVLTLLRTMLRLAQRKRLIEPGALPTEGVKPCKEQPRKRFFLPHEERRLVASIFAEPDETWRAYFALLLILGKRRGELLAAQWRNVDLAEQPTLILAQTKSGEPDVIPLPPAAVAILRALPRVGGEPFIFAGSGATGHRVDPGHAWRRICARAEVADARLHDLRRTLSKRVQSHGGSIEMVAQLLSHAGTTVTKRHYDPHDREAVRAVLEAGAQQLLAYLPDKEET